MHSLHYCCEYLASVLPCHDRPISSVLPVLMPFWFIIFRTRLFCFCHVFVTLMSGFHMCPFRCPGHAPAVSPQKGTCLFIVHRQQWVRNGTLFGNCSVYNISIPPHTIPCLCAYPALKMSLLHTHDHDHLSLCMTRHDAPFCLSCISYTSYFFRFH